MSDRDVVIRVEGISKLYRLGEVGTGSLAHDVNRWWHKVRGKEDPYLKIGEVNDRTKPVSGSKKRSLTTTEHRGRCEMEQSQIGPKGEGVGATESKGTESTERGAGGNLRADSGEFLEGHSQAGLQMDSEKLSAIRSAKAASGSLENSSSVLIRDISGKKSSSGPATRHQLPVTAPTGAPVTSYPLLVTSPTGEASLRPGEFFAVKDVSFELRRGELRSLGQSEKEISKKCLGAAKVPDSGRRRHQCLGLIGHNGAGKTTLLKMLNGLIKPDAGSITMRGRVGALIALGAAFPNTLGSGRSTLPPYRHAGAELFIGDDRAFGLKS